MKVDNERLARVRDLFVFQCFTGVRYSDIENLSWNDIKNSTWSLRTQKTKDIIQIPLSSYALSILARYKEWDVPLPVISNQKMNKYLKELCKIAKINDKIKVVQYRGNERIEKTFKKYEVIGSHTARRTFISLSLRKGMKPDVIMAITGHKTYRMMQKYLKIADEHKREEMDKVWGPPLRRVKTFETNILSDIIPGDSVSVTVHDTIQFDPNDILRIRVFQVESLAATNIEQGMSNVEGPLGTAESDGDIFNIFRVHVCARNHPGRFSLPRCDWASGTYLGYGQ